MVDQSASIKLHLGCGINKLQGWINIDSVEDCQPDVVHDIVKPLPYSDESVDEILAEDLLEHFDKYLRFIVFSDWARVLKIEGRITLQVPDFKKILFRFFKFGFDNFVDFIFGENMLRSKVYLGHFGNHKWAYSQRTLNNFVRTFGIEPIDVRTNGLNIRLIGEKKRHVSNEELDKLKIYSHANNHGVGEAEMPIGLVREKIKIFQNNK